MRVSLLASLCLSAALLHHADAARPSNLNVPPMGWNSWNNYGCDESKINEWNIKKIGHTLVDTGLAAAGYVYVNLDDCWIDKKKKRGEGSDVKILTPDAKRFPSGMRHLSDYLHSLGLKFGIYADCGTATCQGCPGSLGYERIDSQTFAEWGVDYLKLDGCYADPKAMRALYQTWSDELIATKRDIVFSCSWPAYVLESGTDTLYPESFDWKYIGEICNLWRNFDDISTGWDSIRSIMDWWALHQDTLVPAAGVGRYNDPDMLEIGNKNISPDMARTQMSVWAILSAPLIMGNDPLEMDATTLAILKNEEVIAIQKDQWGLQGRRMVNDTQTSLWIRTLSDGVAVAVVNMQPDAHLETTVEWSSLGLIPNETYNVRDLWARVDIGRYTNSIRVHLPPHGCAFYKFTPVDRYAYTNTHTHTDTHLRKGMKKKATEYVQ